MTPCASIQDSDGAGAGAELRAGQSCCAWKSVAFGYGEGAAGAGTAWT